MGTQEPIDYYRPPETTMRGPAPEASPYGPREDATQKGNGFFGMVQRTDDTSFGSSELSGSTDFKVNGKTVLFPLMQPTNTKAELDAMLSGTFPDSVYTKGEANARERLARGLSPFAQPGEKLMALPTEPHSQFLQDLPGILSRHSRMMALQNSGGDFQALTARSMTQGSFGAALKRQSAGMGAPNLPDEPMPSPEPFQVAFGGNTSAQAQLKELDTQETARINAPLPGEPVAPRQPYTLIPAVNTSQQAAQMEAQDRARTMTEKNKARLARNKMMGLPLNTP